MIDYNAIIFDLDGTLINSLDIWLEADKKFITGLGFEYNSILSEKMKTMHFDSACRYLADELPVDMTPEQVAAKLMELVEHAYLHEMDLKPFVREYIEKQYSKGIKMCVATSNIKPLAEGVLKSLGIYEMLEFVITSDEVGNSKETPDIFTEAVKRMGSSPNRTIVFEDSVHAAKSSAKAGFFTVGVFDNHYANDYHILKSITQRVIMSFEELL